MKVQRKRKCPQLNLSETIPALMFVLGFLVVPYHGYILAQTACSGETSGKTEAQLRVELEACDREIAEAERQKKKYENESASFTRDIAILDAKIDAAKANIKAKNIAISNLTRDIAAKQSKILVLDGRLDQGRRAIAAILRKTNDISSYSLVEAMLSDKSLSEFFVDIDTYASTKRALSDLFTELRTVKTLTESEKVALDKKREVEAAARAAQEAAKKEVERSQAEKAHLLAVSQSNVRTYAQEVADRQAKAAQIRAVLFPLADSKPIDFGTALTYAEIAEKQTGIRAAFILGIFATESGKGKDGTFIRNVGQCLLTNTPEKGDGKNKNTGSFISQVMKGSRDADPFLEILKELGLNPYSQPVSCPVFINGVKYGYGGAMGPAQFIPSTWRGMRSSISRATGKSVPNPWDPADAFMAAALYLRDLGAGTQNWTNERTAACKYNSGKTCYVNGEAGPGLTYGNNVMWNADIIQRDIDFLRGV